VFIIVVAEAVVKVIAPGAVGVVVYSIHSYAVASDIVAGVVARLMTDPWHTLGIELMTGTNRLVKTPKKLLAKPDLWIDFQPGVE